MSALYTNGLIFASSCPDVADFFQAAVPSAACGGDLQTGVMPPLEIASYSISGGIMILILNKQ